MIYYLYKITNNINGHFYIGRRSYEGDDVEHDSYFGSGKRLKAAIKKYGKENFTKTIIQIHDTFDSLVEAEKQAITEELVNLTSCYNLAFGGNGGYTYYEERVFHHTEETKEKISRANKGRSRPDARENLVRLGINKWWEGKTRTVEDKEMKSVAAKKAIEEGRHPSTIKTTCPHCGKSVNLGNAKRWHFDNCKKKES